MAAVHRIAGAQSLYRLIPSAKKTRPGAARSPMCVSRAPSVCCGPRTLIRFIPKRPDSGPTFVPWCFAWRWPSFHRRLPRWRRPHRSLSRPGSTFGSCGATSCATTHPATLRSLRSSAAALLRAPSQYGQPTFTKWLRLPSPKGAPSRHARRPLPHDLCVEQIQANFVIARSP